MKPWSGYKFVCSPGHWDRTCHTHPTEYTDRIDAWLNEVNDGTITLTEEEIRTCVRVGTARHEASKRLRDLKVSVDSGLDIDIRGVGVEIACCDYLGIEYEPTVNTFRKADLPFGIEARGRKSWKHQCKVRPDDDDDRKVVHGVCWSVRAPITLVGWITARDGKGFPLVDPANRLNPRPDRPFHGVPLDALRPMKELKKLFEDFSCACLESCATH